MTQSALGARARDFVERATFDDPVDRRGGRLCDHCGRRLPRWRKACAWCHLPPSDQVVADADALTMSVRHRFRIECLTCSRPSNLADARARAGRCPACAGTLVFREVL